MDKVFIDSDIILDLICERENYKDALGLFTLIEENKVSGCVSPLIFANIFYILRKHESSKFAIQVLTRLKALLNILTINEKIIELALSSDFKDFEDAIQYNCALSINKIDFIVTRDTKDFKHSILPVLTPEEAISSLESA